MCRWCGQGCERPLASLSNNVIDDVGAHALAASLNGCGSLLHVQYGGGVHGQTRESGPRH